MSSSLMAVLMTMLVIMRMFMSATIARLVIAPNLLFHIYVGLKCLHRFLRFYNR
ncbi:hypothetical protein D3C76_1824280 [compost metagenome]